MVLTSLTRGIIQFLILYFKNDVGMSLRPMGECLSSRCGKDGDVSIYAIGKS